MHEEYVSETVEIPIVDVSSILFESDKLRVVTKNMGIESAIRYILFEEKEPDETESEQNDDDQILEQTRTYNQKIVDSFLPIQPLNCSYQIANEIVIMLIGVVFNYKQFVQPNIIVNQTMRYLKQTVIDDIIDLIGLPSLVINLFTLFYETF